MSLECAARSNFITATWHVCRR